MNNDGEIRIGTKVDNSGFEKGVKDLKKEAEQADKEITQIMSKSASSTNKFGNAIGGVAKKAVSLGSALFDVVAVGAGIGALAIGGFILGKALDKANGKSEQLKANLSYIGFVASKIFENLLQPAIDKTTGAVNGLVGALYKAVVYIGYILSQWTGKDLFAGSSVQDYAKSMEDANKSAKGTAKATKQIKKDLMGFDEVNKLTDNASNSGTSGSGSITLPSLPNLGEVEIPKWVQWIADHKDEVLSVVDGLLMLLTFSKVIKWLTPLKDFFGMFTNSNIANNLGLTGTQLGLIVGSIAVIGWSIHKIKKDMDDTYDKIQKIYDTGDEELDEWLKGEHEVEEYTDRINQKKEGQMQTEKDISNIGHSIVANHKEDYSMLRRNLIQQDKILLSKVDLWRQGKLTKEQEEELIIELQNQRDEVERIAKQYEPVVGNTQELYDKSKNYKDILEEIGVKVDDTNRYMDLSVDNIDRFGFGAEKASQNIDKIGTSLSNVATQNLPDKNMTVNLDVNTTKAKSSLSSIGSSLASGIQTAINNIKLGSLIDKFADLFNGLNKNFGFKFDVTNIKKKLGLRQGGIINVPGRGVALGNNIIGGEAGAEAVVPLNDETMDRLGSAIARHMTINATMINQMNGRTISRELKTIMNENDFSYNR